MASPGQTHRRSTFAATFAPCLRWYGGKPEEATLVVNAVRSVFQYLDSKVTRTAHEAAVAGIVVTHDDVPF